jgi:predicted amidohydrolase/signal recognition particle receptor subunit beta
MISKILIITSGGTLCYSKNFFSQVDIDEELISGFLTAISEFAQEIKGGKIKALRFRNFNYIYSYYTELDLMFILAIDIDDLEEEARTKLELMKNKFVKRYRSVLENWMGNLGVFEDFNEFVEEHMFIPPKILLIGEQGVGKTTIMNLFPGETILELDDDLKEVIQKEIDILDLKDIKKCILREIDIDEFVNNSKLYRTLLNSVDIICIVTNSAASNLGRTEKSFSILKEISKKADFYIIANFQDLEESSFEPEKIEELFNKKTFGFSAIQEDSKQKILTIFTEILTTSVIKKTKSLSVVEYKPLKPKVKGKIDDSRTGVLSETAKTYHTREDHVEVKKIYEKKPQLLKDLPRSKPEEPYYPMEKKKYQLVYRDLLKEYPKIQRREFRVGIAQIGLSKTGNIFEDFYEEQVLGLLSLREDKVDIVRSKVKKMMEIAQAKKINILVFPEITIDLNYAQLLEDISDFAKAYDMYIIPGSYHDQETKRNISLVIGPDGILWEQEKHIPAIIQYKGKRFKEGIDVGDIPRITIVCNTEFGRIAITICRDFLDMDLRVELKNFEPPVDIILNPAFTPVTADFKAAHFDARRSIYAYCFFVNVAEFGDSLIYTPEKERIERIIQPKEENLIYKDIDLFKLRSERKKWEKEKKKEKQFIQSTR